MVMSKPDGVEDDKSAVGKKDLTDMLSNYEASFIKVRFDFLRRVPRDSDVVAEIIRLAEEEFGLHAFLVCDGDEMLSKDELLSRVRDPDFKEVTIKRRDR